VNSNVLFLVAALVLSVLGATIVWLLSRPRRPKGSSVEQFNRHLRALSTERGGPFHAPSGVRPIDPSQHDPVPDDDRRAGTGT
jgi:hypothetical protein